jgi:hypothetical protein
VEGGAKIIIVEGRAKIILILCPINQISYYIIKRLCY